MCVAKEPLTYAGLSSKKGNCNWHMQYGDEKIRVLADGLSTSTFMILFISCKFARPYYSRHIKMRRILLITEINIPNGYFYLYLMDCFSKHQPTFYHVVKNGSYIINILCLNVRR